MQAADEIVVEHKLSDKLIELDPIGLGPFSLAIILGILLGKVYVPLPGGASFSLGNTGGALLMGLDRRLQRELRMPVHRAEDPLTCVARGTGRVAEALHLYQRALAGGQELRRG